MQQNAHMTNNGMTENEMTDNAISERFTIKQKVTMMVNRY